MVKGSSRGCLRGTWRGTWKGTRRRTTKGTSEGTSKRTLKWKGTCCCVKLRSGKVQVRSGLVQVWFSLELRFNSLELDSEVGRFVVIYSHSILKDLDDVIHKKSSLLLSVCKYFPQ